MMLYSVPLLGAPSTLSLLLKLIQRLGYGRQLPPLPDRCHFNGALVYRDEFRYRLSCFSLGWQLGE